MSPTNIRISGPLISMPAASAVQKIAGIAQPAIAPCRAARRRDRRAPSRPWRRRTVSSSMASVLASRASTPSRIELAIISAGEQRRAARDEGERRPIGQQHRADRADQRGHAIEPDRGARLRHAERLAGFHHARPAANRCRPASCSGPRPGNGCRRSRRSRSSAWWPARSAPRRGRPAESGRSPAGTRAAQQPISSATARACERGREVERRAPSPRRRPMRWRELACSCPVPCSIAGGQ